jgi:pimeloyl-ACP methyl ester carboxylesterase
VALAIAHRWRWLGLRLTALLLSLYVVTAALLYANQRLLIFPGRMVQVGERPRVAGMEVIPLATPDGATEAWLLPPLGGDDGAPHPVLIYAHGNGEVIDWWTEGLDALRRWGLAVLLVEYPGYGRSRAEPSEAGIRAAMLAAYDALAQRADIDRHRIVAYGQSLGGGAVGTLVGQRPLAALILHSTFTSLRAMANAFYMPAFLLHDVFATDQALRTFDGPTLVLHGRRDELIPVAQGAALAALAPHATLHLYDCGHGCWMQKDLPMERDIHTFLVANGIVPPPAEPPVAVRHAP